jgi:putative transposase
MARANRHYIPGYVWHITHRCHKREFLLKFVRDRRRWLPVLFEVGPSQVIEFMSLF